MTVAELIKNLAQYDFNLEVRCARVPKGNRKMKADLHPSSVTRWGWPATRNEGTHVTITLDPID